MTNISERLLGGMIKEGIISAEDREIYLFGIKELFSADFYLLNYAWNWCRLWDVDGDHRFSRGLYVPAGLCRGISCVDTA